MGKMDGKVFLVYGGGSGMAKASAILFAQEGAKVVVADLNAEGAAEVVKTIKEAGGEAECVSCNCMEEADIKNAVDFAAEKYGKLDCMQYQPGFNPAMPIADMTVEMWNKAMTLNLTGHFLSTKYAAAKIIETAGKGAIVLTSSSNSIIPYQFYSAYCTSKAGVDMFARVASLEYGPKVRINTINPGFMNTPQIAPFVGNPQLMEIIMAHHTVDRIGEPEDYAKFALFLCSDDAGYITGCNMLMDGGGRNYGYPDIIPPFMQYLVENGIDIAQFYK